MIGTSALVGVLFGLGHNDKIISSSYELTWRIMVLQLEGSDSNFKLQIHLRLHVIYGSNMGKRKNPLFAILGKNPQR